MLEDRGIPIEHIHRDGRVESHDMAMRRLMSLYGIHQVDLFHSSAELLQEALARHEEKIAYVNPALGTGATASP